MKYINPQMFCGLCLQSLRDYTILRSPHTLSLSPPLSIAAGHPLCLLSIAAGHPPCLAVGIAAAQILLTPEKEPASERASESKSE